MTERAATLSATQAFVVLQSNRITMIVALPILLWSTFCWINGMKYARQLTTRNSAICVCAPVLIYILCLLAALILSHPIFQV